MSGERETAPSRPGRTLTGRSQVSITIKSPCLHLGRNKTSSRQSAVVALYSIRQWLSGIQPVTPTALTPSVNEINYPKDNRVTARWYLYVATFLLGISLVVAGIVQGNSSVVFVGVIIGVVLFFSRKYIEPE